jgi:hypothetical protein
LLNRDAGGRLHLGVRRQGWFWLPQDGFRGIERVSPP